MNTPYGKWVMFSIGVYVLAAAVDKLVGALVAVIHLIR